jgi:hypothetical protein
VYSYWGRIGAIVGKGPTVVGFGTLKIRVQIHHVLMLVF